MTSFHHLSVMPDEVIALLQPRPGGIYLDGTLGGGGHTALIAELCGPGNGMVIGIDQDQEALEAAGRRLAEFGPAVRLVHGNFAELDRHLDAMGIAALDGFILDLGVSSHQLDSGARGFSFQQDAPLDMRMDAGGAETAADLVNELPEQELERIIRDYGEERWAKRIAAFIVKARGEQAILTTLQLTDIIKGAIPKAKWEERIHPATRTFQALRIAVNRELESLEQGLRAALDRLKPGGRAAVISFHSLEDRIVKHIFREYATGCTCPRQFPVCVCGQKPRVRVLTSRPVTASEAEITRNPRARSAKLRGAEKLDLSA
ncbi:16S rRNA (cytosine(1402)-N(4))-methyltransferase RsmH [Oryzomonas japonica]|uniref:Ribosomal RNA small subunit methyltransferase H n=1 Tax=Oryzomonas japonica TaxID=2603858 RepID=A0A7J4ZQN0_9BACT|nr:16S rRNA (cytosine(1402)-N(4))-methyltransferase RsmH [Oryzomonas japonica]KAB0665394.1 16S rRNA (cytosine(1402)-N(4))-methyltransferase RsmH [Oryzomonas japonica]